MDRVHARSRSVETFTPAEWTYGKELHFTLEVGSEDLAVAGK